MGPFMASVAVIFGVDFTGPHMLVVIGLSFFLWDRTIGTSSLSPEAPEELSTDYSGNSTPTLDVNNENQPAKFKLDFVGQLVFITLAILSLMVTLDFQSIRLP